MGEGPFFRFEISDTDLMARKGTLEINGRKVDTPELMPVVNPNRIGTKQSVDPGELKERFSFNMIITNSYIIRRNENLRDRALEEGLHRLLGFDGIIMTDSGTFQSYMYGGEKGEVDVDPLDIIDFQKHIGSDIGTILDKFTVPESDHARALEDLGVTMERAASSLERSEHGMEIAVPVQGGSHPDIRKRSGSMVRDLGVKYAPIGGVVPIMESYDYPLLVDVIASAKRGMGPAIPTHLFGAGHPMIIPLACALGCDLFDSASYVKYANDGRYMTRERTYHLDEMGSFPCSCPTCSGNDPSDLEDLPHDERSSLLARHNLWTIRNVIDEVRNAISEGTLWEVVERSAMSNPSMYAAVKRLMEHSDLIEENAPRSCRRFMCCSSLSLARPEFGRYRAFLEGSGIRSKNALLLSDWSRNYSAIVRDLLGNPPEGWDPFVDSPLGPFPYELNDMYPLGQAIFPPLEGLDEGMTEHRKKMRELVDMEGIMNWPGRKLPEDLPGRIGARNFNIRKVKALIRYQFRNEEKVDPVNALFGSDADLDERIDLVVSRNTGKIRNVRVIEGEDIVHLLSLRAEDGLFSIKIEGARRLHSAIRPPWSRVIVDSETGEFNAKGLNVFCKFITGVDRSVRSGDDVLVVDENDELLAVGKAVAGWQYLEDARSGVGVKVREGILSGNGKDND